MADDTSYERGRICDEAPNFSKHQKFTLFDILHNHKCENAIVTSGNDSHIDLTKLSTPVILELFRSLCEE